MAFGVKRPASIPVGRRDGPRDRRDRWARVAIALVVLGIALRIASFWTHGLGIDANRYAVMGQSWADDRTFTMPWGDVYNPGGGPEPSHHYPPVYPVYLGLFYEAFGFSEAITRVAAIAAALLAIGVTYLCTRDLYGRRTALTTAAIVAVSPLHLLATTQGYSENLLLALFVATLWAILRSLDRPPFILLAGVFAGLSYLTRSSVGGFFVIAGLGGLAWRLRWHGWAALRNPWYVAAIGLFGTAVVAWGARNWHHFGTWQTSSHTAAAYAAAMAQPWTWAALTVVCLLFLVVLGYVLLMGGLPWPKVLRGAVRDLDEHSSALALAVVLPLLLAAPVQAALWIFEERFFALNVRYVSFAIVPAAWLVQRHVDFRLPAPRRAAKVSATLLVAGTLVFAFPREAPATQAAEALGDQLQGGETVAFVGVRDVYRYYFALTDGGQREVSIEVVPPEESGNLTADWALSPSGVQLEGPYRQHSTHGWTEGPVPRAVVVWQRVGGPV